MNNEIVTNTETRLMRFRPSFHVLRIQGIQEEHRHIEAWRWVHVESLMEIHRGTLIHGQLRTPPSMSCTSELFDRYGLLCGQRDGRAAPTWVGPRSYAYESFDRPRDEERHGTSVPLSFSNTVLDLGEHGIVKVTSFPRESGLYHGKDNIPMIVYDLIAHDWRGEVFMLRSDGKHGYKMPSMPV